MNLCGADYEHQVHDIKLPNASFHCGPCVKEESTHLNSVFSDDGADTVLAVDPITMETRRNPLDIIEEQLDQREENAKMRDEDAFDSGASSTLVTIRASPPHRVLPSRLVSTTSTARGSLSYKRRNRQEDVARTPATGTLTSLTDADCASHIGQPGSTSSDMDISFHRQDEIKRSASGSIDGLLKRLENGFSVKLYHSMGKSSEDILLYLDSGRRRLCLRGDQEEKQMDDVINFWQELPIDSILRIEIDRKSRKTMNQLLSFSLVLHSGEPKCRTYYDLEASSPIEREIIVATLMVVLEQAQASVERLDAPAKPDRYKAISTSEEDVGTLDQPIVCSPSLEEHLAMNVEQDIASLTARRHGEDAMTGLVINLEHLDDSTVLTPRLDELRRRTLSQNDVSGGPSLPGAADDLLSECKSSTQIGSAWCADDVCTLALKDIADSCAGIFVLKQAEAGMCNISGITEEQRLMIEEYIASALGAPSAVFSYLSDTDAWNAVASEPLPNDSESPTKASQGRIRNRACVLNAQSYRLRKLRQEMTFVAALKASKERIALQTTQSFDDARMLKSKSLEKEVADRFHSSALLKHVVGNMMVSSTKAEECDIEYYDSDPEDARPKSIKDPRQVAAESRRRLETKPEKCARALGGPNFDRIKGSNRRVSRKLDEDTIVQIVQQMTNERLTLIWHPTQRKSSPNRSPLCVKVWIESGVCLIDGTFILPKLSWAKYESEPAPGRRIDPSEPQKLELLDICRIHIAETIDRRRHPFAVARRSFLIETQSAVYLFEAKAQEECDRIVFGIKLVIARLASLLMLRDGRAAEEFFGAIAAGVPGEAFEWARGETIDRLAIPPAMPTPSEK